MGWKQTPVSRATQPAGSVLSQWLKPNREIGCTRRSWPPSEVPCPRWKRMPQIPLQLQGGTSSSLFHRLQSQAHPQSAFRNAVSRASLRGLWLQPELSLVLMGLTRPLRLWSSQSLLEDPMQALGQDVCLLIALTALLPALWHLLHPIVSSSNGPSHGSYGVCVATK